MGWPFTLVGASLCRSTGKGLPGSGPGRQAAGATHKSSRHAAGHSLPSQPHAEPFCQKIPCTPACAGQVISPVLRPTIQPLHGVPLPPQLPSHKAQRLWVQPGLGMWFKLGQQDPRPPPPTPTPTRACVLGISEKTLSAGFAILMGCSLGMLPPAGTVWGSLPEKESTRRERERPGPRVLAGALEPQTFPCCAWDSGAGFWEGPSPPPIQELSPSPSVLFLIPPAPHPIFYFSASLVLSVRIPSPMGSQQPSISGLWPDHRRVLSASALAPCNPQGSPERPVSGEDWIRPLPPKHALRLPQLTPGAKLRALCSPGSAEPDPASTPPPPQSLQAPALLRVL